MRSIPVPAVVIEVKFYILADIRGGAEDHFISAASFVAVLVGNHERGEFSAVLKGVAPQS